MSATATLTTVRDFPPVRVLCDTRPARRKHRAPSGLAARILAAHQSARGAFVLAAATAGGVLAAVVL